MSPLDQHEAATPKLKQKLAPLHAAYRKSRPPAAYGDDRVGVQWVIRSGDQVLVAGWARNKREAETAVRTHTRQITGATVQSYSMIKRRRDMDYVAIAESKWNGAPDWVVVLASVCHEKTQSDVALSLGVDQSAISAVINNNPGKSRLFPSIENAVRAKLMREVTQ